MKENVTFRYITPIYNFDHFVDFKYDSKFEDATFSISLKGYGNFGCSDIIPENDLIELFKYGKKATLNNLYNMHHSNRFFPPTTSVILVIDVIQPLSKDRLISVSTKESNQIFNTVISALLLHSTSGLAYEYTYLFRSPDITSYSKMNKLSKLANFFAKSTPGYSVIRPHAVTVLPSLFRNASSDLKEEQFSHCRTTFDYLIKKEWGDNNIFDNVLQLAMNYHRTSFTLERIEHAFLMLMIAFEAMYKEDEKENSAKAAKRIAQALSNIKADYNYINTSFTNFSKLRNSIAHGNPKTIFTNIDNEYKELYKYVTDSIIFLISENINFCTNNYYDELDCYLKKRYEELPESH